MGNQNCQNQSGPEWLPRYQSKIEKSETCWRWTGAKTPKGYGQIKLAGRREGAHRVAWYLAHGEWPGVQMVCHACDNPLCVNPDHLFLGDAKANAADKVAKGRCPM